MSAVKMMAVGRKLANAYSELCRPLCVKYGINQTGFDIILFCANNPEYNTARDICEIRGIKSGIASVASEQLIEDGLLLRVPDPTDRRINRLVPTERATALIEEGRAMQRSFTEALHEGITEAEESAMESITERLEKNIISLQVRGNKNA